MILADKIINERKKNGWSQEDLAEMLDVSRQSVSKWEGAQSVPDLQKILKMAEVFGVSTDYLLKDELEPENREVLPESRRDLEEPGIRRVSLEDATEYISIRKEILPKIGLGVFLCITSPVILVFLSGLSASGLCNISRNACVAIGLVCLFLQIGCAVYLFITKSGKLAKFDFLEKEDFETEYGVDGMVKERLAENEGINTRALTTGVLMCVLGALPLIICSVLGMSAFVITGMVCLLLLLIGCAVYLFVSVCGVNSSYHVLLQDGDYTKEKKRTSVKLEPLVSAYWMFIVVVYLAISFLTGRWDRTWIIWAVSGVLFALIRIIAGSFVIKD
ncbi:MAG: helix-turn-helix domain-containing protein [Lachnospiraceae bacterium]|nr:helix-turn-helix domain-containing protein [Lachnospiraceae bacterium]